MRHAADGRWQSWFDMLSLGRRGFVLIEHDFFVRYEAPLQNIKFTAGLPDIRGSAEHMSMVRLHRLIPHVG